MIYKYLQGYLFFYTQTGMSIIILKIENYKLCYLIFFYLYYLKMDIPVFSAKVINSTPITDDLRGKIELFLDNNRIYVAYPKEHINFLAVLILSQSYNITTKELSEKIIALRVAVFKGILGYKIYTDQEYELYITAINYANRKIKKI